MSGLHLHNLCENNSYDLEKTLEAVEEKFGHLLSDIEWLNLGGGHLMTEKNYNTEHLIALLQSLKERYPHLDIIMEPGSAFAWQTGVLVATVNDIVENCVICMSYARLFGDALQAPYTRCTPRAN